MRVAVVGKGGSGKSTIAGILARALARRGERVLALDVDTVPGLAYSVGLGAVEDGGLPEELAELRENEGWVIVGDVPAEELVSRHALGAPDGVRFLQLGKLPGRVRPGSTVAFRHVMENFRQDGWSLVADLAAGTRQSFFGWAGFATTVLLVVDPGLASLLSARRLSGLQKMMENARFGVALSKCRREELVRVSQRVERELSLPVWAEVPYDEQVAFCERRGVSPMDDAPDSAAVEAVSRLANRLHELDRGDSE